jgi:hypothetical protein
MDPAVAAVTFIVIQDRHTRHKLDLLLSFHHNHNHMKKSLAGEQGLVKVVVLIIALQNLTDKVAIVSHTKII